MQLHTRNKRTTTATATTTTKEKREEGSNNEEVNKEDNTIMPPKISKVASLQKKATKKESGVKQITESAKKLKIAKPRAFSTLLSFDSGWVYG